MALGRAIVRDPKVFLFDEPLSNLDAALRVRTRGELITMGSRICVMNRGRVVQGGRPLEVYREPADTFIAAFIGSPPANLLAAEVAAADGIRPEDIRVAAGGGGLPARLIAVEPLGAETILVLALDGSGKEILARVGPEVALRPGERVTLEPNLEAAHLFDPASTRALPPLRLEDLRYP